MIQKIVTAITIAGVLVSASPSFSQSNNDSEMMALLGTWSISAEPWMSKGSLSGCTLVYDSLYQDWVYRQGAFLKVTGSVGLMIYQGVPVVSLKVVVAEVNLNDEDVQVVPSPPSRAYLMGANYETNLSTLIDSFTSDTPGALISVFESSPSFEIRANAIDTNVLTIAFNSLDGDSDILLNIELDVVDVLANGERIRSGEMKVDFLSCMAALVDSNIAALTESNTETSELPIKKIAQRNRHQQRFGPSPPIFPVR